MVNFDTKGMSGPVVNLKRTRPFNAVNSPRIKSGEADPSATPMETPGGDGSIGPRFLDRVEAGCA